MKWKHLENIYELAKKSLFFSNMNIYIFAEIII